MTFKVPWDTAHISGKYRVSTKPVHYDRRYCGVGKGFSITYSITAMHNVYQPFKLSFLFLFYVYLLGQRCGRCTFDYGCSTLETGRNIRLALVCDALSRQLLSSVFSYSFLWPYSCTRHAGKQHEAALRFPFFIVAQIGVFCTYITWERKMCLAQTRFMRSAWMAPQYTRRNKWQCITSHPLSGNL